MSSLVSPLGWSKRKYGPSARCTALRPHSSAMAVGAVHRGQVADVHRMLERLGRQGGNLRATLLLVDHRMARVAILADDLAFLAHVVAIVTAEAALIVQ